MSSGRTWKWASIIAVACSCSASNNFTFPSHSYGQPQTRRQTLLTGDPATARTGNKLNNVPGSPLLRTTSLRLLLTRLAKKTVCIYNRWGPFMEIHLMEDVLLLIHDKKQKKRHYSWGIKPQHLMELMFVILTMLILLFYGIIYDLMSILYIFFLYARVAFSNSLQTRFDPRPNWLRWSKNVDTVKCFCIFRLPLNSLPTTGVCT